MHLPVPHGPLPAPPSLTSSPLHPLHSHSAAVAPAPLPRPPPGHGQGSVRPSGGQGSHPSPWACCAHGTKGLVRALGALGPPWQIVGGEGLARIQAGLGREMARQLLEPVSLGPLEDSAALCSCVCVCDWGCSQPCPWAALAPGHPLIHSLTHSLEPVTLEGAGGGENPALGPPLQPLLPAESSGPLGTPSIWPSCSLEPR